MYGLLDVIAKGIILTSALLSTEWITGVMGSQIINMYMSISMKRIPYMLSILNHQRSILRLLLFYLNPVAKYPLFCKWLDLVWDDKAVSGVEEHREKEECIIIQDSNCV